jgi:hypothetical protein
LEKPPLLLQSDRVVERLDLRLRSAGERQRWDWRPNAP